VSDQAEVREAVAPWVYECVGFEKAGHKGLYLAAIAYSEAWSEGWSDEMLSREVSRAGFQLAPRTINNRRRALEGLAVTAEPSTETLEAFADAYLHTSNPLTSSKSNEWYTPIKYIESVRRILGDIDLDPASCEQANETVGAKEFYGLPDDGLHYAWRGRVFMNPPWGDEGPEFGRRLIQQFNAGNTTAAIGLFNAHATDTDWFQPYFQHVLCFTDHRIDYDSPDDKRTSSTHGSVFVYLGDGWQDFAEEFTQWGAVVARYK
jgi:hypothetical protein